MTRSIKGDQEEKPILQISGVHNLYGEKFKIHVSPHSPIQRVITPVTDCYHTIRNQQRLDLKLKQNR